MTEIKSQLKKILKFAPLFLTIFLAGCATGGAVDPEVRVDHRGNIWGTRTPAVRALNCQGGKMVICKQFGATKYCRCDYPGNVQMPRF
jgi:hypothetical protein